MITKIEINKHLHLQQRNKFTLIVGAAKLGLKNSINKKHASIETVADIQLLAAVHYVT